MLPQEGERGGGSGGSCERSSKHRDSRSPLSGPTVVGITSEQHGHVPGHPSKPRAQAPVPALPWLTVQWNIPTEVRQRDPGQ